MTVINVGQKLLKMIAFKCIKTFDSLVKCTICSISNDCVVHVLRALDAFGVVAYQIHYHDNSWALSVGWLVDWWSSLRLVPAEFDIR